MKLTEQIQLKWNRDISKLCHIAKNLYNKANYIIRQAFFNKNKWIRYNKLYYLIKNSDNYKALPPQTSQQILKIVDNNWSSFFKSMKEYKKNKNKFNNRPKPPKYKKKNGEFLLIFTNQQCKIKDGYLYLPKKCNLNPIKTRIDNKLHQVRIIPKGIIYVLEIIYEKEEVNLNLDKNRVLGVDIGVNNLVTIADSTSCDAYAVKGGVVKSINQLYNKLLSKYTSIKDKQGYKFVTKRINKITLKRNNKIKDFFHKVSRKIVNYCILKNIGKIVIGYNKNWKNGVNLGKVTNQKFVQIPFLKLIDMIRYKAKLVGIEVILVDESYTSKCSFLDNEPIGKRDKYLGKRICRGLFKSKDGVIINADVNASYNIIRKVFPEAFIGGRDSGCGLHPRPVAISPYYPIGLNRIS